MPTVPIMDTSAVSGEASGQGLMGGGKDNVTPEHVLMAAATMHDMGRLVEPSGASGLKLPHVTRGSGTGRKVKSRATGGPVEAGEPYLVGEQGPEVVVPKEKGTVVAAADIDPTGQQSPFGLQKETASGGGKGMAGIESPAVKIEKHARELEGFITQWAQGKMKASAVQAEFKKRGWTTDLRRGGNDVEAFDPSGKAHYMTP